MTTPGTDEIANPSGEDAALIEQIAQRNNEALGKLYDRYAPLLLALARRVLRDVQAAEEILQEVFLQVWNQADRYQMERSSVSTWLVLLTRSRAIDRLRSRQSRERTLTALEIQRPPSHTSDTATATVLKEQQRRRLASEMAVLPPEQRQVLELAFYSGLSQTEIAAKLDIPLGTVKTRTLLAMKKLRRSLADDMETLL
jgi:RNA polymerase sigma-70 factor (ECF subfamily)